MRKDLEYVISTCGETPAKITELALGSSTHQVLEMMMNDKQGEATWAKSDPDETFQDIYSGFVYLHLAWILRISSTAGGFWTHILMLSLHFGKSIQRMSMKYSSRIIPIPFSWLIFLLI